MDQDKVLHYTVVVLFSALIIFFLVALGWGIWDAQVKCEADGGTWRTYSVKPYVADCDYD